MINISEDMKSVQYDNEQYLEELMTEYGTQLKRYAHLMLKDEHLAEDAVQKTFINFYYSIKGFRHESSTKNYLYSILTNECKQIKRRSWFRKERNTSQEIELEHSYNMDDNLNRILITQSLAKIKPKYREIIILYYYQKFSVADIAEILNLTKSAVKSRLKYARENLKKYLEEVFIDE